MHYGRELNSLANWKNPVLSIKDPLKQRWAEIVQTMSTHVEGVCPLHIYVNRRPLESQNSHALEYRVNNFQPLTKDAFDRAISGITENILSADIQIKAPEQIVNGDFKIKGKDVFSFCFSDIVRVRETDPNGVIVVMPKIQDVDEQNVSIIGVDVLMVSSSDIDRIGKDSIRFKAGKADNGDYYYSVDDGQYTLEYPDENGKLIAYPIVKLSEKKPYVYISDNVVYEGKYKVRLPYLFGAAAWGDKFYGQESDFSLQATRWTYIKEVRAKERCDEVGMVIIDGVHCMEIDGVKHTCKKCGGAGYVKDDSPFGTIYVDYSKLNSEERAFPQVIQWAEPPQSALTSSKEITYEYYEKMCEALGLLRQNFTNQSGVSKQFDYKEKLSTIYKILQDNIRVCTEIYQLIEYMLIDEREQNSVVYLVGEVGASSVNELLLKLSEAKKNQAPASIITSFIDQIYQKTLPQDVSDAVIRAAKYYDKLYIYGSDELTTARAQLGTSVNERDVIIHNTIIDVIMDYYKDSGVQDVMTTAAYLDTYYQRYATRVVNATSIGLL